MVAKSDTGSHPELQSNLGAGFSLSSSSTTSFSYRLLQSHAGTADVLPASWKKAATYNAHLILCHYNNSVLVGCKHQATQNLR